MEGHRTPSFTSIQHSGRKCLLHMFQRCAIWSLLVLLSHYFFPIDFFRDLSESFKKDKDQVLLIDTLKGIISGPRTGIYSRADLNHFPGSAWSLTISCSYSTSSLFAFLCVCVHLSLFRSFLSSLPLLFVALKQFPNLVIVLNTTLSSIVLCIYILHTPQTTYSQTN